MTILHWTLNHVALEIRLHHMDMAYQGQVAPSPHPTPAPPLAHREMPRSQSQSSQGTAEMLTPTSNAVENASQPTDVHTPLR